MMSPRPQPSEKRGPGTHCLRMCQSVPKILVHHIILLLRNSNLSAYDYVIVLM